MRLALVKMPYTGSRNVPELAPSPEDLDGPDLREALAGLGARLQGVTTVRLDDEQEREHGSWHRMGLACGNLAAAVAEHRRQGRFVLGLLGNCTGLLGMLGGLQRTGAADRPRRVGMLFLDAHGDFNTPETTLSGMLGGMPVAVAAGLCLARLRREAGIEPAVDPRCIAMAGVRDLDPAERRLLEEAAVDVLSVEQLRRGPAVRETLDRLGAQVETLYVHVDMDVLDPAEVPHHPTAVPGGLTSRELAPVLAGIFADPKAAAIGIASTPSGERDPGDVARTAAHRLIAAVIEGAAARAP